MTKLKCTIFLNKPEGLSLNVTGNVWDKFRQLNQKGRRIDFSSKYILFTSDLESFVKYLYWLQSSCWDSVRHKSQSDIFLIEVVEKFDLVKCRQHEISAPSQLDASLCSSSLHNADWRQVHPGAVQMQTRRMLRDGDLWKTFDMIAQEHISISNSSGALNLKCVTEPAPPSRQLKKRYAAVNCRRHYFERRGTCHSWW